MKLYLCEKPSQAKDIATELGQPRKQGAYFETNNGVVTWAYGHLLEQADPESYGPEFKTWSFGHLPIIPAPFRIEPKESGRMQLEAIHDLLKTASEVVIATDADREGEMIAREILVYCKYRGPVSRLWLSALDPASIQKALKNLKKGSDTEALYFAAKARSEADWLVGMNMTRAVTVLCRKPNEKGALTIGRVQTPTLALVVRRDREIAAFRPRDYFEIVAQTRAAAKDFALRYAPREEDRLYARPDAQIIADKARGTRGPLKVEKTPKTQAPPRLFSLSSFQKEANARFGWGADKSLTIAQSLYEKHKVTTYPRSDCDYLPEEQKPDIEIIVGHLSQVNNLSEPLRLAAIALKDATKRVVRSTVFNTAKVTAHHAIIPTKLKADISLMTSDEKDGFALIASRYLANLLPDYEYLQTKLSLPAAGVMFSSSGTTPVKPGWKAVQGFQLEDEDEKEPVLPDLPNGVSAEIVSTEVQAKKTSPPKPYTEGTLIDDMKNIAKFVTDATKKARLKETSGIGTEATRANIIAKLCARDDKGEVFPNASPFLITTKGKGKTVQIRATPKAMEFITLLEMHLPALADPAETAVWEEGLESVAERVLGPDRFVADITSQIRAHLAALQKGVAAPAILSSAPLGQPACEDRVFVSDHCPARDRCWRRLDFSRLSRIFCQEKVLGPDYDRARLHRAVAN